MNTKLSIAIVIFAVIVVAGIVFAGGFAGNDPNIVGQNNEEIKVVLHKSESCGCCGVYGNYMDKLGYEVEVHNTDNLHEIKQGLGVPMELESCHTTEIEGYVVEGHIPEEAVQKLLSEKPDIKGIGMAGMPSGSPGMPGPKTGDFVIYEINHDGTKGGVFVTL